MVQRSSLLPDFTGMVLFHDSFHLRLVEQLGKGAYGVVYLAEDLAPRLYGPTYYAVKCMLRYPEGSDLARQQYREISYHRAVSGHPNIVGLHAVIEDDLYTFLVLDYCGGGDLFGAIMDRDTYAHNTAAIKRTFLQIVDALAACHEKGVFHRDLKPENILCSPDDQRVYLADFGLATRSVRSSTYGCGSSFYMSPECLGSPQPRHRKPYRTAPSDVWALGTILCNLATGRNPWHVASPAADTGFAAYLARGEAEGAPGRAAWLHAHLPLSRAAADVLARVFEPEPARRIALPALRAAVAALPSFFPAERAAHAKAQPATRVPQEQERGLSPLALRSAFSTSVLALPPSGSGSGLRGSPSASGYASTTVSSFAASVATGASATLAGSASSHCRSEFDSDVDSDSISGFNSGFESLEGSESVSTSFSWTDEGEDEDGDEDAWSPATSAPALSPSARTSGSAGVEESDGPNTPAVFASELGAVEDLSLVDDRAAVPPGPRERDLRAVATGVRVLDDVGGKRTGGAAHGGRLRILA